ncbi:MAG: glycosyltransferase [Candidatus Acidiferrales bacterium]
MTLPMNPPLILFWVCLAVVAYVYLGYPLLLALGAFGRPRPVNKAAIHPLVSIIVPARNEESVIEAKLNNLLASDYPRDALEILIGSDGSSDRTEEIAGRFAGNGIGLISFPQQVGKSVMQNRLVAAACGSILVFTDADCFFSLGTLSSVIANFADSRVGLVTARPRYQNEGETDIAANERLYLRYESWLRNQESERGILAMGSGSLLSMRRPLWQPLHPNRGEDFVLPLAVARAGLRSILESQAIVTTRLTQTRPASMLQLKSRIVSKDFPGLFANADLLNPLKHGRIALALWSHKLLRWLVPVFLIALFGSNVLLLGRPFFKITLLLQALFYALALAGCLLREHPPRLVSIPFSFCLVNLAAAHGIFKCLFRKTSGQWNPLRERYPAA